jgi:hypothetical protein
MCVCVCVYIYRHTRTSSRISYYLTRPNTQLLLFGNGLMERYTSLYERGLTAFPRHATALLCFIHKSQFSILCSWFRSSLIYINNCLTRCNTKQSIYYSASSLNVFRVSATPVIRSTQNCNYSLRYWSYFLCSYLPGQASLAKLEGGSCTYRRL